MLGMEVTPAHAGWLLCSLTLNLKLKGVLFMNNNTPRNHLVDFKEVKAQVNLTDVLDRYDLMPSLNLNGDRLSGVCPIHQGTNSTQFRVSISKNCFNCFGKCGRGGNVIDFVSLMEDIPFRDAALLLQEWFIPKKTESASNRSNGKNHNPKREQASGGETGHQTIDDEAGENPPLTFELKSLKPEHPYFDDRGITPEAIEHFGLGYCSRGYLREHIAIPIHNRTGELVAYAGRWPGDPPEDGAKYKLPKGFKKSLEVFNLHRALKEPGDLPLVVVEGFFDCIALWEAGIAKCVALMGSRLSSVQEELLVDTVVPDSEIEILFDSDEAGQRGAEQARDALARHTNVRMVELPGENQQPDHLSPDELATLFE